VLTAVNRRALDHYRQQGLATLPVDALERRARILHAMGEDDQKRGEMARALAQFQEASRTTAALLAAKPNDPERIYAHAQSEFWVGSVAWRTERFDAAQVSFENYARLARRLIAIDPTNADWLMEVGYADSNIGTLLLRERNRAVDAEARFRAALDSFAAAARRRPGDDGIAWDTADGHAWLANAYRAQHRYALALGERERQATLLQALRRGDPKNARYASGALNNTLGLGQIELDMGNIGAALSRLDGAYAEAGRLTRDDPENAEIRKQHIAIGLFIAKALLSDPTPDRTRIMKLLAACGGTATRADPELTEFCAVLTRRAGTGSAAISARRPERWLNGRFSPRWGIDFTSEDRSIH
jgi:tetratricopeptide (TPR) repeat protein